MFMALHLLAANIHGLCAGGGPTRVFPANPQHAIDGLWCAPSFRLDDIAPEVSYSAVDGVSGAFVLRGVLSPDEAKRMVQMADRMKFERPAPGDEGERLNGALSWVLHDELVEALGRRMAPHLPQLVRLHNGVEPADTADGAGDAGAAWARQCEGAPEGLYKFDGLSSRCRIYRYEPDGLDRFAPHYDEVWPGSRLEMSSEAGSPPTLAYDSWLYGRDADESWTWAVGDRVSQLSVLLYLTDDFGGGETVCLGDDGVGVPVKPITGAALCFGQDFRLGRECVAHSAGSLLHEGWPVTRSSSASEAGATAAGQPPLNRRERRKRKRNGDMRSSSSSSSSAAATGSKRSAPKDGTAKYVLRTDVQYMMPEPPADEDDEQANAEREAQLEMLKRMMAGGAGDAGEQG